MALVLVAGLAACGDDDDDDGSAVSESCSRLVEFNTAASAESDTSTPDGAKALGAQLAPLWEQALPAVPESARSDAEVVTAAIDDLESGDDTAFNADATFGSYTNALTASVDSCGFARQDASATEANGSYAFKGVPKTLDSGVLAVTLENEGAEPHVMVVFRKNDGEKRSAEELLALPEEESQAAGTEVGAVFAEPGTSSVGLVDLTPGDYIYFCPIPIGGAEDAPPHFTEGMYGEFSVS